MKRKIFSYFMLLCFIVPCLEIVAQSRGLTPPQKKKGTLRSAIYDQPPSGYVPLDNTTLYYRVDSYQIDLIGQFGEKYYSSTYGDYGYLHAFKVNNHYADYVNCETGSTIDDVFVWVYVTDYNGLAKFNYLVTNQSDEEKKISLGSYADVMIGDNDRAPITTKRYLDGSPYGLQMAHDQSELAASLVLLFGQGMEEITPIDDYWFGYYGYNSDPEAIVGQYYKDNMYIENGDYDSALGWCWKDRVLPPQSTTVFSVLIGVGDVTLLPMVQQLQVTPIDQTDWNDIAVSRNYQITGTYFSPASHSGQLYYSVDDSEWQPLTDVISSETSVDETIAVSFVPEKSVHTIRVCAKDEANAISPYYTTRFREVASFTVDGLEEQTYSGSPIELSNLIFNDPQNPYLSLQAGMHYNLLYENNVNAGEAAIQVEGCYPYSIGYRTLNFTIKPASISGTIGWDESVSYSYTGTAITPEVSNFIDEQFGELTRDQDYTVSYENNLYPGEASIIVQGINNFTGKVSVPFTIQKCDMDATAYTIQFPSEVHEFYYDGQPHGITVTTSEGVGHYQVYYTDAQGVKSTDAPTEPGTYSVSIAFEEGAYYKEARLDDVDQFSILIIDERDWAGLQQLYAAFNQGDGWTQPWDLSEMKHAGSLPGVTLSQCHVVAIELPDNNVSGTLPTESIDLPNLQVIDFTNNHLSGNVGKFAALFPELTTLKMAGNELTEVSPVLSETITTVDLGAQQLADPITLDLGETEATQFMAQIPSILLYNVENRVYNSMLDWNLAAPVEQPGWEVKLYADATGFTFTQVSEEYAYQLPASSMLEGKDASGHQFMMIFGFKSGDVDFTGVVDILDVQSVIQYIQEEYTTVPFNYTAANLYADEQINVQDLVKLVDVLLGQEIQTRSLRSSASQAYFFVEGKEIVLHSAQPVAAMDWVLATGKSAQIKWNFEQFGLTSTLREQGNHLHGVAYSLTGGEIPAGRTVIGTIQTGLPIVVAAQLARPDAKEVSVTLNTDGTPTGMQSMERSFSCRLTTQGLVLETDGAYTNVQWNLYRIDGRKVSGGTLPALQAGTSALSGQLPLEETCYLLVIQADQLPVQTLKLFIK